MKLNKIFLSLAMAGSALGLSTSCSDMLEKGNEYVIYTEGRELTNPADTVTNLAGILYQLQNIAVRTNLLGEVRADLVKINENATLDLKSLANFDADVQGDDDANQYNVPRDYYAVINNCNYYLAHADSTAGNTNRNEKYFKNEIGQVHSIRAWVYLQTVLAYGRIPLILEPVVTKLQSEAQYPMVELVDVCDAFIEDLKPYVGREYPDPGNFGGSVDPKLCFFPTQVVLGDLYLWKAVATRDRELAKLAAKAYYDYIMWDLSGKSILTMSTNTTRWSEEELYREKYRTPTKLSLSYTNTWGSSSAEGITVIPMNASSVNGAYNELQDLYNYTYKTEVKEASISPTQMYIDLSESQDLYDYDTYKTTVQVTRDKLDDEQIEDHLLGDLRFYSFYDSKKITHNMTEYEEQTIEKHTGNNIGIYRQTQLYLRLAEALNYAGYPRFAKLFLTLGPNNEVINNEVLPYYTTAADSAFIKYFNFNTTTFVSVVERYTPVLDSLGTVKFYDPMYRANVRDNVITMWGIHSRGAGLTFLNPNYAPAFAPDSTAYPYALASKVGHHPERADYDFPTMPSTPKEVLKPSTWDKFGSVTLTEEEYYAYIGKKTGYSRYQDSVKKYIVYTEETLPKYNADMADYNTKNDSVQTVMDADMAAYDTRHEVFMDAYNTWYNSAYSNPAFIQKEQEQVDELILNEQALELAYEGHRYYDLMRRALWYDDNSRLANPIAKRNSSLQGKLMNRKNWYLHWKNKIGL